MAWNVYQTNMNFPQKHLNYNISVYPSNKVEQNQYEHLSQMGSNVEQNHLGMNRPEMRFNVEQNNLDVTKPVIWSEVEMQIVPDDF